MFADAHNDTLTEVFFKKKDLYKNDLHFDIERCLKYGLHLQIMAVWQNTRENVLKNQLKNAIAITRWLKDIWREYINILDNNKYENKKVNVVLEIEDISIIRGFDDIDLLRSNGYKFATITWNHSNIFGGGAFEEDGLSQMGKQLVKHLLKNEFIIDLSHSSNKLFWDVLKINTKPFIISHSNIKNLCDHPRNVSDQQLKALREYNGLIGINFYKPFLSKDYADIDTIIKHICYVADLIGHEYICFGSDFDGAFDMPDGITGIQDFIKIKERLFAHGFTTKEVEDICFNNLYRFIMRK